MELQGIMGIKKKYGTALIMLMVTFLFLYCYYYYRVRNVANSENIYKEVVVSAENMVNQEEYNNGNVIEQTFHSDRNQISSFRIMFRKLDTAHLSLPVTVEFGEKEGTLIESWTLDADNLGSGEWQYFALSNVILEGYGKDYIIRVFSENLGLVAPVVVESTDSLDVMSVDESIQDGKSLVFSLANRNTFLKKIYLVFMIIVLLGLLMFCTMVILGCKKTELYFLLLGLCWGSLYTLMFPPSAAPDENSHILKAYRDADTLLFMDPVDSEGRILARKTETDVVNYFKVSLDAYAYYSDAAQRVADDTIVPCNMNGIVIINTPITSHLPQTLGVVVARLLHMNGVLTLYMGMFTGLLFYLICCFLAIKWIPWGKEVLMVIALFPMNLELAGSFSYDCTIIAVSYMIIGYMMHLIYDKETVDWKDYILMAVMTVWIAPCKIVYLLISGFAFAIPDAKSKSRKAAIIGKCTVIVPGMLVIIAERLNAFVSIATTQSVTGAASEVQGFTLQQILADPLHSIGLLFNTWFDQSEYYLQTIVGGSLAWFQVHVSWVVVCGFILVLFLALVNDETSSYKMSGKQKYLVYILSVFMTGAIVLAMWLDFTPTSLSYVAGVQGRYFLPFFPLLFLTLKNGYITVRKKISTGIVISVFILQFLAVLDIWGYAVI